MNLKRFFALLFLSIIIILVWWVHPSFKKDPNPVLIEIPQGVSAREIAKILEEKGVIRSPLFFLFLSRGTGKSLRLKPGPYLLERNRYWQSIRKLEAGRTASTKFTIPEGLTSYEIAQKLRREGLLQSATSFLELVKLNSAEGRLYPETYFFIKNSKPEELFQRMIQMFNQNFNSSYEARSKELNLTQSQILILASIIEKEAEVDEERATISSVYHNRLRKGMLLQADPTVQYALSHGKYWKGRLTYKDLKVNSPYNTYQHGGLPPGPICNPGKKSIEAALFPAQTNFLYFVSTGNKTHYFFTNYKEHLQIQHKNRDSP